MTSQLTGTPEQTTALDSIGSKLGSSLSEQGILITEIQQRLHRLLDKRQQEKDETPVMGKELTDFVSKFGYAADAVRENNDRLNKILSHLSEII